MSIKTFPVTLKDSVFLAPGVKQFTFDCPASEDFRFIPGQFITMHFEHEGKTYRRSYSIANVPNKNNQIEFTASFIPHGVGSSLLFSLKKGDTLQINGPFGRLILKDEDPARYILVATGTGITPYRAMRDQLQEKLNKNPALRVAIVFGTRTPIDRLYHHEFAEWAAHCPQVTYRAHLSQDQGEQPDQHTYAGYVQSAFAELHLQPDQDLIYLCGNPGMIDESFETLKSQGFAPQSIIREKYISSK